MWDREGGEVPKECEGGELRVGGEEVSEGLGGGRKGLRGAKNEPEARPSTEDTCEGGVVGTKQGVMLVRARQGL